jgi:hypothetical protein
MLPILGIDPGRSAALALLQPLPRGGAELLGAWNVYGSGRKDKRVPVKRDLAWAGRLGKVLGEIDELAPDGLQAVYIEDAAANGKTSGGSYGPDVWLRMGHFQGRLLDRCSEFFGLEGYRVPVELWTGLLQVPKAKRTDPWSKSPKGWHRCSEATRVEGWVMPGMVHGAEGERTVARAEATLVALAGVKLELLHGGSR